MPDTGDMHNCIVKNATNFENFQLFLFVDASFDPESRTGFVGFLHILVEPDTRSALNTKTAPAYNKKKYSVQNIN
ncbi:hypothetical protein ACFL35_01250 [Candidatus Riflebacteria bacterium]